MAYSATTAVFDWALELYNRLMCISCRRLMAMGPNQVSHEASFFAFVPACVKHVNTPSKSCGFRAKREGAGQSSMIHESKIQAAHVMDRLIQRARTHKQHTPKGDKARAAKKTVP